MCVKSKRRDIRMIEKKTDGFYIEGLKWFITGGNWGIINYRQNFGATSWFPRTNYPEGNGVFKNKNTVEPQLKAFHDNGITLLRVGLLDDCAAMFDQNCKLIGYNDVFRKDVFTFLELAIQYKIKVEFTLVDFLIAGKGKLVNGLWIRGRHKIIESPGLYIDGFLGRFLREFGNHPALFGFDVINEPEWMISPEDGGKWKNDPRDEMFPLSPIPFVQFQAFVAGCIEKIRQWAPGKFITVGVSCPNIDLVRNFDLDYYALHHYDWMGDLTQNLGKDFEGKPWILEEYPGKNNIGKYLSTVHGLNGAGALVWNLNPGIDSQCYTKPEAQNKLKEIWNFVTVSNIPSPYGNA
jgi:hypothetical protein